MEISPFIWKVIQSTTVQKETPLVTIKYHKLLVICFLKNLEIIVYLMDIFTISHELKLTIFKLISINKKFNYISFLEFEILIIKL